MKQVSRLLVAAVLVAGGGGLVAPASASATDTEAERPVCPPGWEHIPLLDPIGEVCIQPDTETPMFPAVAWQTASRSPSEDPPASAEPQTEPEDSPASAEPQTGPENPPANDRPTQQPVVEEVPEPEPEPVPRQDEQRTPQPQTEEVPETEPENEPLSAEEQAALEELLRCQQNPAECEDAEESPDDDAAQAAAIQAAIECAGAVYPCDLAIGDTSCKHGLIMRRGGSDGVIDYLKTGSYYVTPCWSNHTCARLPDGASVCATRGARDSYETHLRASWGNWLQSITWYDGYPPDPDCPTREEVRAGNPDLCSPR